jgi:5-methylcytosine-specific restriction endonuclease McrA
LKFIFQVEDKIKEYDPETKKPTHKTLWLYRCKNQTSHPCPIKNCNTEMVYGPVENFEMAHIIPKSQGGKLIRSNLIPTCKNCNRAMSTDRITKLSLKDWAWPWLPKN